MRIPFLGFVAFSWPAAGMCEVEYGQSETIKAAIVSDIGMRRTALQNTVRRAWVGYWCCQQVVQYMVPGEPVSVVRAAEQDGLVDAVLSTNLRGLIIPNLYLVRHDSKEHIRQVN